MEAGEKQTGRTLPLSLQYAPFSGTPKPPHPVKQRQNFIECRRLDCFKEATPGIAGLAAAATIIFSHVYACIPLKITSKIYPCYLLSNRLALACWTLCFSIQHGHEDMGSALHEDNSDKLFCCGLPWHFPVSSARDATQYSHAGIWRQPKRFIFKETYSRQKMRLSKTQGTARLNSVQPVACNTFNINDLRAIRLRKVQ